MPVRSVDPSMAACFFCATESSLHEFLQAVEHSPLLNAVFTVTHRPADFSDRPSEGLSSFDMDDFDSPPPRARQLNKDLEKEKQREVVVIDGEEWGLI
jgi:hypothetical protein